MITATNELFRRQGYHATSLKQISEAAPATIGSIYHFFPGGKEELGVAVIETTGAVYRDLFVAIASAAASPSDAYVDFFAGAAAVLEETDFIDPCPIGTIAREVANTSEPLRQAAERVFDSWTAAAREHLEKAGVPERHADELASLFVATVEGMFVLGRTRRDTAAVVAAGTYLAALVDSHTGHRVDL